MTISRPRLLVRGIVALAFALVYVLFTVAGPIADGDKSLIAPRVMTGVGTLCLAAVALAAIALYDGAPRRARRPYRVALVCGAGIPVAGLGTGLIVWIATGSFTNFGISIWAAGLTLLTPLILLRGQARDMRVSGAAGATEPGAG